MKFKPKMMWIILCSSCFHSSNFPQYDWFKANKIHFKLRSYIPFKVHLLSYFYKTKTDLFCPMPLLYRDSVEKLLLKVTIIYWISIFYKILYIYPITSSQESCKIDTDISSLHTRKPKLSQVTGQDHTISEQQIWDSKLLLCRCPKVHVSSILCQYQLSYSIA